MQTDKPILAFGGRELRLERPLVSPNADYVLEGHLVGHEMDAFLNGGSLLVRNTATGIVEEAYFDGQGHFSQTLTLAPDTHSGFVVALCDSLGQVTATTPLVIRHREASKSSDSAASAAAVLPRGFSIQLRGRDGQHELRMLAPAGSPLPGKFLTLCRTTDQCGRVVVPLWEETRLLHQLVVSEVDAQLPVGAQVDVELQIAVDRAMTLRVLVRQAGRGEMLQLPAPAAPRPPTSEEVSAAVSRITALLPEFTGEYGASLREALERQQRTLQEAMAANDTERAAAALAELKGQKEQMQLAKLQVGYPPPQRLSKIVKRCLFEAAGLADRRGRDREQWFGRIYALEQAAEQAQAEKNAIAYRESIESLLSLETDLHRMQQETLPLSLRDSERPATVHDVLDELKDLQAYLAVAIAAAELLEKSEMTSRLRAIDQDRTGLAERAKRDARAAQRDVRRALAEVAAIEQSLTGGRTRVSAPVEGMLEAMP